MQRERHPYDDGYWLRYDGYPIGACHGHPEAEDGWCDCDSEIALERES